MLHENLLCFAITFLSINNVPSPARNMGEKVILPCKMLENSVVMFIFIKLPDLWNFCNSPHWYYICLRFFINTISPTAPLHSGHVWVFIGAIVPLCCDQTMLVTSQKADCVHESTEWTVKHFGVFWTGKSYTSKGNLPLNQTPRSE